MTDRNIYFEEAFKALSDVSDDIIAVDEDTIKVKDGKWTNKGKEGTHGFFKTKKEADAQRRAMFARESIENVSNTIVNNKDENSLSESTKYSVNDAQQMKDAKEEIESKKNPDDDIEQVVDLNADDESQLKDSYVGDVVLRCTTCHTLVYKKLEEIVKDEDDELVNKEDECPNCNATTGYEVIGKVVPLKDDDEKEDEASSEDTTQEEEEKPEENVESDDKEETTEEPNEEEHEEEEKEESHDEEEREVSDDFIDEIDNESFNHAINSYLCETYDNVKSYEMTDGTIDENGVILIEGTITFKSGKTLNTSFKFVGDGETTKGLTKYKGMNESLTKDDNSFKLVCTKDKTKLVTESLVYNYLANDNKTRVYGKTTRK